MKGWKLAFIVSVLVLLVTNAMWANALIDQGITLKYAHAMNYEKGRAIRDLGALVVQGAASYTKKDVLFLLREAKPEAFIVDEGETLNCEGIQFRFSEGRLVEVAY